MLIGELDSETLINVNVTEEDKAVQITSQVIELSDEDYEYCKKAANQFHYDSFIVVEIMKEGERVLNFLSVKIKCVLTALKNGKPYSWNNVKILRLNLPEYGDSHIILSNDDIETFNRRREYRLWLGYDGLCKFGESQVPKDVIVKDVSCSGMSMIVNKDKGIEPEVGEKVVLQFYDRVYSESKQDYENILYTLEGKIVRYVAMNNNRVMIGCRLSDKNDKLEKMIYVRQRLNMSVNDKKRLDRNDKAVLARDLARASGLDV